MLLFVFQMDIICPLAQFPMVGAPQRVMLWSPRIMSTIQISLLGVGPHLMCTMVDIRYAFKLSETSSSLEAEKLVGSF